MESLPPELQSLRTLRVALVHDWLFHMRGGEKCLRDLCELFPDAEIFTLFHEPRAQLAPEIQEKRITASFLNYVPSRYRLYRQLLPLFPVGVEHLSRAIAKRHKQEPFDLVISVSHCAVKNIRLPHGLRHICYCLTPARYFWDQFERYLRSPWKRRVAAPLRALLQRWDRAGSGRVDQFIAISRFVADRVLRVYEREAAVVYPGVELDPQGGSGTCIGSEFLVVNALVPYKNTDLIVRAFNELGLPLRIVGRGSEYAGLRALADSHIEFEQRVSEERLWDLYRNSVALIFAAEEDFGMTPVEAQSAGRPVISLARGGALETIQPGKTGVCFSERSPDALVGAVRQFLQKRESFRPDVMRKNAEQFSRGRFFENFLRILSELGFRARTDKGERMQLHA